MNLVWTNFENRSIFGEVMANIVVDCFLTHSVYACKIMHQQRQFTIYVKFGLQYVQL